MVPSAWPVKNPFLKHLGHGNRPLPLIVSCVGDLVGLLTMEMYLSPYTPDTLIAERSLISTWSADFRC